MRATGRFPCRPARRSTACLAFTVAAMIVFTVSAGLPIITPMASQRAAATPMVTGEPRPPTTASAGRLSPEAFKRLPLRFEAGDPNVPGQFLARAGDCNINLTATEAALAVRMADG